MMHKGGVIAIASLHRRIEINILPIPGVELEEREKRYRKSLKKINHNLVQELRI